LASLEDYLSSEYLTNKQDIEALESVISKVSVLLAATGSASGWPYQYNAKDGLAAPAKLSVGTTAMVLCAIGRVIGECSLSKRYSAHLSTPQLISAFDTGFSALLDNLKDGTLGSNTFGDGNPLTLSHVVELNEVLQVDRQKKMSAAFNAVREKIDAKLKGWFGGDLARATLIEADRGEKYHQNSFVPLRAVLAARQLDITNLEDQRRFFETSLHEQLSFSTIPDSRFDPAELVFSLEGLLICAKHAVDSSLFYRVLEVLSDKQNTSAHWRPSKPFLATSTGSIFLPLSVEVANSLLRSIAEMDIGRTYDTYTSTSLSLLRRFWMWLRARAVQAHVDGVECLGWHSEHVNEPDLIHLWDTSQVLEFMLAYRELLEREIRQKTLLLSRLHCKTFGCTDLGVAKEGWKDATEKYDPSPGIDGDERVYERIGLDFVSGWADRKPKGFSMLLYGPPGTGKTTVAEELAKTLNMPLVVVTVSDFLGSGGANVESRAKAIFTTLECQRDVVILFDEIDSFLLDRDSELYRKQDSLFQFLTPGMLTKFNELRRAKQSIFVIATNYENRIDPAIKRAGRIDYSYLLPLPNAERRKRIMVSKEFPLEAFTEEVKRRSVFFGYSDLAKVAEDAGGDTSRALALFSRLSRASSPSHYIRRIKNNLEDFAPREIDDMLRLAKEADASDLLTEASREIYALDHYEEALAKLSAESQGLLSRGKTPSGTLGDI
jgi:hypothetical protein